MVYLVYQRLRTQNSPAHTLEALLLNTSNHSIRSSPIHPSAPQGASDFDPTSHADFGAATHPGVGGGTHRRRATFDRC